MILINEEMIRDYEEEKVFLLGLKMIDENVVMVIRDTPYTINPFKNLNSSGGKKQHGPRIKIAQGDFKSGEANVVLDRAKGLPIFDHKKTSFSGVEKIRNEIEDVALAASYYYEEFKDYAKYNDEEGLKRAINKFNSKSEKEKDAIIKKQREKISKFYLDNGKGNNNQNKKKVNKW